MQDPDKSKELLAIESLIKRVHQGVLSRNVRYSFRTDGESIILFCGETSEVHIELTYSFEEDSGQLHTRFKLKFGNEYIFKSEDTYIKNSIYKLTDEIYRFCASERAETDIKDFEKRFFMEK